jgi:Fic family protein
MPWNWQLADWPHFKYDPKVLPQRERAFLLESGKGSAFLKTLDEGEYHRFVIEILSSEGLESSVIEGEILDRESLESSIQYHLGLKSRPRKEGNREHRMAHLLCNVYENFAEPLSHEMLWTWHAQLFEGALHSVDCGKYRTHAEPMQIVSHRMGSSKIFFEAPPSGQVYREMTQFIEWYHGTQLSKSILERAAIAHVYFESIHPFEDGNGRIGRVLVEKILSQGIGQPILIALSKILEKRKKEYYAALERCNKTLKIDHWMEFFADAILQAQGEAMGLLYFLIKKGKFFSAFEGFLNPRQEKALFRMFAEGQEGFKGGLSAENYIAITKASRATATRDLNDLVQKGALLKTGELRHTRYWLNI